MFSGFLKNLNYTESLQDEFLIHGSQTKPNSQIEVIASKIKDEDSTITILKILYHLSNQLRYQNKNSIKFNRTASEIMDSGFYTGCSDFALIFETLARYKKIPTIHVQTAGKKFIEKLQHEEDVSIIGHHFCECNINGKWILVDPLNGRILERYNPIDLNIGQYYAFAKSTDIFETGIHNIYENNKKIKEIFSGFDINQFHPANDERKEKEEYR